MKEGTKSESKSERFGLWLPYSRTFLLLELQIDHWKILLTWISQDENHVSVSFCNWTDLDIKFHFRNGKSSKINWQQQWTFTLQKFSLITLEIFQKKQKEAYCRMHCNLFIKVLVTSIIQLWSASVTLKFEDFTHCQIKLP